MRNPESITTKDNNSIRSKVVALLVIAGPLLTVYADTLATTTTSDTADKAPKSVDIEKTHKNGIPEEVLEEARKTGKFSSDYLFSDRGSWEKELKSLEQLRGMKLTEVHLSGKGISDISPLKGMPLKNVRLTYTSVTDFSALEGAPIERLSLQGAKINDISFLKSMTGLRSLSLRDTNVSDISTLEEMSSLRYLNTKSTPIKDYTPIKGLTLHGLDLNDHTGDNLSSFKRQIDEGTTIQVGSFSCPVDKNYQVDCSEWEGLTSSK